MSTQHIRAAIHIAALLWAYLAIAMLIPAAVDMVLDNADWLVFARSSLFLGGLATAVAIATRFPAPPVTSRFGFLLVTLLWTSAALAGSLPLLSSSAGLSVADAVFESVSALTTTGSTVMSGLDELPPGILLWRSMLQWIGGLGVIALTLFVLPFLRVGGVSYLKIESSDIDERPFERFAPYTTALTGIYGALTLLCAIAYAAAGMPIFDAVNHAMTTLATGGFSTHDASFGHYADSPAILWTGTAFMFIGALPFSILMMLALRGRYDALGDPQIKTFTGYTIAFVVATAIYVRVTAEVPFGEALTHAAFNFVSIITTTGYASDDYSTWGPFVVGCAFVATFLGGCSGSTSGAVKAYRFLILFELLANGLRKLIYPNAVYPVRYGDRHVSPEIQRAVMLFIAAFVVIWLLATILLTATGLDLVTASTGALTALTNVGPGLGDIIGPAGNFAPLSDIAKWILSLAMLLGRLEILAVLVLLAPSFWQR